MARGCAVIMPALPGILKSGNGSILKRIMTPWHSKAPRGPSLEKRREAVTAKDVAKGVGAVLLLIMFFAGKSALDKSEAIPVGSNCSVSQPSYGLKDLDKAYDDLDKAEKANDEIGLTELAQRGAAVLFSAETSCLVIDTDFFKHFTFYRQVRILGGPYFGKAFWVKVTALQKAVSPPSPPRPVTCHDPNEAHGSPGNCVCKEGYKRDATTKCVPE